VDSYEYLKNSLIALFEVPESLQLAKNRVLQILNFWHVKGKVMQQDESFLCPFLVNPFSF
jgi:hypothetical protein